MKLKSRERPGPKGGCRAIEKKEKSKQISADVKVIMLIYARKTREGMSDIFFQFSVRVRVAKWQTMIPFRAKQSDMVI
jgi:hypothetical protein